MNSIPLVSVIVPIYNQEKYLNTCLRTIVNQTYSNLEILLIDDGSTDKSGSICNKWGKKDKRIHVIHKINNGIAEARNTGLYNAHGDYICYVDSDDWIKPVMIEKMLRAFEKYNSVDLVFCEFYRIHKRVDYKSTNDFSLSNHIELLDKVEAIQAIIKGGKITNYIWSGMYRRNLFSSVRFPKNKNYEDMYTMMEIISHCRTIAVVNEPLYFYRVNKKGITYKWTFNNFNDYCDASVHEAKIAIQIAPRIEHEASCKVIYDMLYVWKEALISEISKEDFRRVRVRIISIVDSFYSSKDLAWNTKIQVFILKFLNFKKNGLIGYFVNKMVQRNEF